MPSFRRCLQGGSPLPASPGRPVLRSPSSSPRAPFPGHTNTATDRVAAGLRRLLWLETGPCSGSEAAQDFLNYGLRSPVELDAKPALPPVLWVWRGPVSAFEPTSITLERLTRVPAARMLQAQSAPFWPVRLPVRAASLPPSLSS